MGSIIKQIVLAILKYFSRKEGDAEKKKQENEYENENNFSVHAPKWIIPLLIVYELFFGGFAVCSYYYDFKIAILAFAALCILGFILIMFDIVFRVDIDGQQISVTRFLRGTKFFHCRDIISVRKDNDGNVIVLLGKEKININSTMVNKDRFFSLAQKCAWSNIDSGIRQTYRVYRNKMEYIFLMGAVIVFLALAAICVSDFKNMTVKEKLVDLPIISVLVVGPLLYLIYLLTKTIIVDETKRRFSYKKGFVRKSADIMQIVFLETKKRFLENAYNLFLTVEFPDGKTDRVKFASLDENSDRFEKYLIKEVFQEEESDYED